MRFRNFVSTSGLLLATVFGVFAQPPMAVQIPFSFQAAGVTMPAGQYLVKLNVAQSAIRIQATDSSVGAYLLPQAVERKRPVEHGKLVFHKYGNRCFLRQIWVGGQSVGKELPASKLERELARGPRPTDTVTVAFASPPRAPGRQ